MARNMVQSAFSAAAGIIILLTLTSSPATSEFILLKKLFKGLFGKDKFGDTDAGFSYAFQGQGQAGYANRPVYGGGYYPNYGYGYGSGGGGASGGFFIGGGAYGGANGGGIGAVPPPQVGPVPVGPIVPGPVPVNPGAGYGGGYNNFAAGGGGASSSSSSSHNSHHYSSTTYHHVESDSSNSHNKFNQQQGGGYFQGSGYAPGVVGGIPPPILPPGAVPPPQQPYPYGPQQQVPFGGYGYTGRDADDDNDSYLSGDDRASSTSSKEVEQLYSNKKGAVAADYSGGPDASVLEPISLIDVRHGSGDILASGSGVASEKSKPIRFPTNDDENRVIEQRSNDGAGAVVEKITDKPEVVSLTLDKAPTATTSGKNPKYVSFPPFDSRQRR